MEHMFDAIGLLAFSMVGFLLITGKLDKLAEALDQRFPLHNKVRRPAPQGGRDE